MILNEEVMAELRREAMQEFVEAAKTNQFWQETVNKMAPMNQVFPEVVKECYPTIWSFLN